jgi:hypothetical protein
MGLCKHDNFLIADTQGKPYFKLDASAWTSHRQLLDVHNNPVLQVCTLHVVMSRPSGVHCRHVAAQQPERFTRMLLG